MTSKSRCYKHLFVLESPLLWSESLGSVADTCHEAEALAFAAGPSLKHVPVHPVDAGALAGHAAYGSRAATDAAVALAGVLGTHRCSDDMGKTHLDTRGCESGGPESGLHERVPDGDADGEEEGSEHTEHVEEWVESGCSLVGKSVTKESSLFDGWLCCCCCCLGASVLLSRSSFFSAKLQQQKANKK